MKSYVSSAKLGTLLLLPAVDAASPPTPRDWRSLLETARLRQRVTGKTIGGVYTGKAPEPENAEEPAAVGVA